MTSCRPDYVCVCLLQTSGTRVSINDIVFYLKKIFLNYTESELENNYETVPTTTHISDDCSRTLDLSL